LDHGPRWSFSFLDVLFVWLALSIALRNGSFYLPAALSFFVPCGFFRMTNAENTSSAVASLKVKSPKTKSSARESKVSTDRDSLSDTTAAEYNNHGNVTRASKRRKKTDSTLDDFDQSSLHTVNNNSSNITDSGKNQTDDDESETTPAPVTTTKSHKKSAGSSSKGQAGSSKRKKGAVHEYELSTATASSVVTNMTSPVPVQLQESLPIVDHDSESATSASTSAPSTRRNARSANNKKNSRTAPADDVIEASHIVPASKRRRTAEPSTRPKEDSVLETEDEDKASEKDNSPTEAVVEAPGNANTKTFSSGSFE
jgi:hypothetical protein